MDGVLVHENSALPGAAELIKQWTDSGTPFLVLTNNSIFTPRYLRARLLGSGIDVPEEAIWTSALATAQFLSDQRPHGTAYVVGEAGLTNALHDIGKYLFSDDVGPYKAPAYEKLMINTMNMVNYLARGDLQGARIEARRLAVMQKFLEQSENKGRSLIGLGSYLAGLLKQELPEDDKINRLFERFLVRRPTPAELAQARELLKSGSEGWEDLQWLLVNKVEFVHNF